MPQVVQLGGERGVENVSGLQRQHAAADRQGLGLDGRVLLRLGCEITVHPTLDGTDSKPDFLARFPLGEHVIVEAVLATDLSDNERAREARLNALYHAINSKVVSPDFFLCLGPISNPDALPAPRKILKFIKEMIAGLNPDRAAEAIQSGRGNALQRWTYRDKNGFELELSAIPRSPDTRGNPEIRPIGAFPSQARWGGSSAALKKAIKGKAKKYGPLDKPFVVAVNASSKWGTGRDDAVEALFGSKLLGRKPDAVWSGAKNTRLSGVLVTAVVPWSIHCAPVCLYHNPFATRPCRELPWKIPQAIARDSEMEWLVGSNFAELFQLPGEWPGERFDD